MENLFDELYSQVKNVNKKETKPTEAIFLKFNEEFGEFNAEYIKYKGFSYKPYNRNDLKSEMADTLQVLLSIYSKIEDETGITMTEILEEMKIKNKKWDEKISTYTANNKWDNLKPFQNTYDVPKLPQKMEQYHIDKLIECGAIPKEKLEIGKYYNGNHRIANIARWDGEVFQYVRIKYGSCFTESCNHFQDDNGYSLFVPISETQSTNY